MAVIVLQIESGNMIDRIMQSLDESAQVHYGRHTIRHVSLQLAINMKKSNNRERKDFENAILQIGRESTPFSDPPNRISHYQVTLLLSMATEMKLMDFTDIVIENLSLLNHFSKSGRSRYTGNQEVLSEVSLCHAL